MPQRPLLDPGWFVSGTATGIGKTLISRALTLSLRARGARVAAIKPVETGVEPDPLDAIALARACGQPALAHAPGLYRTRPPLSPYAATRAGHPPPPSPAQLAERVAALCTGSSHAVVEGAGGLLVPLDAEHSMADLALALSLPLLLVAPDRLGVLSDVLACCECARARALTCAAVVLSSDPRDADDPSRADNRDILAQRLGLPVVAFPACDDTDDSSLLGAAHACGLLDALRVDIAS